MASFQQFLPVLLAFEGGYCDDPHDPGGATNMGITLPVFKQYAPVLLGVTPTIEALKTLTKEQAGKIYKTEYWDAAFGDEISFQPLADIVVDFYVNAGHHAITLLFNVLNAAGGHLDVRTTLHRQVIDSLRHHDILQVYGAYRQGRIAYYQSLAHEHPGLRRYLHGWLKRVESFASFHGAGKGCEP